MRFYTIFPLLLFGLLSPIWYPAQLDVTGQLLITELYYDTPGDDGQEEWIEITNVGTAVILLSDIRIGDEESSGGREGMKRFPEGAQIGPEQSLIIAQTAVGFRALFGFNPHFEMIDSDSTVPNMRNSRLWATGDVALANDGDEVLLLQDTAVLDAVNYGDSTHYFAPSVAGVFRGQSIERVPANCDSNTAADWQPARVPTPGTVQLDAQCTVVVAAELETLPTIGDIQGTTDISPMVNEIVSFRGVVTGWLEDRNANGITFYTLFVQDVPGTEDGNPATSDGMALFLGRKRPSYQIGDQLRITGQVTEFFGYTEIDDDNLEILVEGGQSPLPKPVGWDWSDAALTDLESWESMLVAVPDEAAVVGATFSSCALIAAENADRLFQRNEQAPTGLVLPIIHTSDVDCTGFPQLKTGDRISNIRGPLIYQFDQFKVVQQEPAALHVDEAAWPERPLPLIPTANQISAATLNLENYFDAVDNTGTLAEPKPSEDDIASRQAKFVHLIGNLLGCPTLLGVQEVENEPLLATLAEALTQPCGFRYTISHLDSPDARGIDVALLSDPRRVSVGAMRLQQVCTTINTGIVDSTIDCPTGRQPLFSRPPLQVDLLVGKRPFTIFVNHFKSKREGAAETAPRRLAQAAHINDLVRTLLITDPQANIIVMGDFNDTEQSPPLQLMTVGGDLTNPLLQLPDDERYSYVFGGISQLIDGILLSPALAGQAAAQTIFHVSADFPVGLALDTSAATLMYHASDHDVPLILLDLARAEEPVVETAVFSTPEPDPPPIDLPLPVAEDSANWRSWIFISIGLGLLAGFFVITTRYKR